HSRSALSLSRRAPPPRRPPLPYTTLFRSALRDSMRILIAFTSLSGNTRDVARTVRARCEERGHVVTWIETDIQGLAAAGDDPRQDRKSTRLNSSHVSTSFAVFCLKQKPSG